MKKDHGEESDAEFQELLYSYIEKNPDAWYLKNENPKLQDVRGKLVLARRYQDENGYGDEKNGIGLIWEEQGNTEIAECPYTRSEIGNELTLEVQDRYCYGANDKWNAIESFLQEPADGENVEKTIHINFLSTKGTLAFGHPMKYANVINQRFLDTELRSNAVHGWIIVDYGTEQIARHVFETNAIYE